LLEEATGELGGAAPDDLFSSRDRTRGPGRAQDGTLFVVGDSGEAMRQLSSMILDPLQGHPDEAKRKRIDDADARETIKELAQLDGAFVVSNAGVMLSAARYIDAASDSLSLPLGLGSRHMAAAPSPATPARSPSWSRRARWSGCSTMGI
jgi:hypothetical protein